MARRIAIVGAGQSGLLEQGYQVTLMSNRTRRGDPQRACDVQSVHV